MKDLRIIDTETYRAELTGEVIGWTILHLPSSAFRPVHLIQFHPEDGPVIIVGAFVYEVEETDPIYKTDEQALDAYYANKKEQHT